MKNLYLTPQSRIELAQTPDIMDDFLGFAKVSGGGNAYAPQASIPD